MCIRQKFWAPATPQRERFVSSTPCDTPESLRSPVINSRSRIIAAHDSAARNLNNEFDKHVNDCFIDRVPQPSTSSAMETIAELSNDLSSTKEEVTVKRDVHILSIFSPKKPGKAKVHENKVACPVCSVDVSEMHINQHLDACLKTPQK
ncbi:hypothetical protein PR048_023563 [Dryococelus australis]|uniref:UBZ4-type domain-containing protein n=1 Tax=Dryococelus australis TaxID=614101 RepID=A0ABQ9GUE2_9NEOP|nr:hypothetical protein PR048_023563 [Dryococelus australis]